mgnify:CR=1 FL=1
MLSWIPILWLSLLLSLWVSFWCLIGIFHVAEWEEIKRGFLFSVSICFRLSFFTEGGVNETDDDSDEKRQS